MAYIKYKEISKYFNFSRILDKNILPKYVNDYVFDDEQVLAAYKTFSDHGLFTTSKIILFDNYSLFGIKKQMYTIPYKSISTASLVFKVSTAQLCFYLDSGYPLVIKFINMSNLDKLRLRLIYSYIIKYINNQKISKDEIEKLVSDDISFRKEEK